jgi:hypothetical protein
MTKQGNAKPDILSAVLTHIQIEEAVKMIDLNPQFLDALIYHVHPDDKKRLGEPHAVMCFDLGRSKELILKILAKASSRHPKLKKIVLWALPSQRNEVDWIMSNLQAIHAEVTVCYLNSFQSLPQMLTVILMDGFKDTEKDVPQILNEIESALNKLWYDEVGLQFSDKYSGMGYDIIKALRFGIYEIERLGRRAHSVAYRICKQKQAIPQQKSTSPANKGRIALARGLSIQNQVTQQYRKTNPRIVISTQRGQPDITAYDSNRKVIEVVAIKSYSLEVTTGSGCRNRKGHKYAVSFKASRDAKAECKAAQKYGLNQIRLIVVNLRTGRRIFDGLLGFDEKVTLREYQ